jgi:hypothetical protein
MKDPTDIIGLHRGMFPLALHEAKKGDRILYWIGQHCGGPHRLDAAAASDAGMCLLFCKRVGKGLFAYLAVKR